MCGAIGCRSALNRWDVLIVGAGNAGLPCAIEAASLGLRTLLVEKDVRIGGCLHTSGGHLSAAGARRQQLAGIDAAALTPRLTLLALGISFLLGLLSGLLPARNASRLSIVGALGRV